ncbi:MAG TPA: TIM barrel protein [Desulfosarcina sp.]|nr:TIM barrel protein [Desulfosarcina sp.]
MTALSTSFRRIRSGHDVESLVALLRDLPVSGVELEYRIPAPVRPMLQDALRQAGIRVVSVHNFFPLPDEFLKTGGSGDLFSLADIRREERQEAVKRTLATIDRAHDLEARAVVLHCGRVEMASEVGTVYDRLRQSATASTEPPQWLQARLAERDRRKPAHLDALRFSLEKLLPAADRRELLLGLETRFHFYELPGPEDFRPLLQEFDGAPLGYWHDTGHAAANEQLGLVAEGRLLEELADRLIGIHLHDAIGLEDHLPPGDGQIDFKALAARLRPGVLQVLELHPGTSPEDVRKGLAYWASCLRSTS